MKNEVKTKKVAWKELGSRLKELRLERGLTQQQVSDATKTPEMEKVYNLCGVWETGSTPISKREIRDVTSYLASIKPVDENWWAEYAPFLQEEAKRNPKEKVDKMTDRITLLREQHGWSKAQTAREIGMAQTHYFRVEGGVSEFGLQQLVAFKKATHTTYDYLLEGISQPAESKTELKEIIARQQEEIANLKRQKELLHNQINWMVETADKAAAVEQKKGKGKMLVN